MFGRHISLRQRHANLDAEISQETARPATDTLRVSQLKKAKLSIKDELARDRLSRQLRRRRRNSAKLYPLHGI